MDRVDWLKEKRRLTEERMDILFAPIYDEHWGSDIDDTHRRYVSRLVQSCPPGGLILDAACGTGKYWHLMAPSGRSVLGIDQSQGMLSRAKAKFPQVEVQKIGLQELAFQEAFDGILCVDAMEFVFPEDWPRVLANFHRALKPCGYLYFTVEVAPAEEVEVDYQAGKAMGLPVVPGESAVEGGYHYYPGIPQVRQWIQVARFTILEEDVSVEYHHFWLRRKD